MRVEAKKVGAKQGLQWIINGFYLFRKSPVTWILLCAILMSIAVILSSIQAAGQIIFTLLSPVFLAGLMSGCNALEQDKKLQISHLFAGFMFGPIPLVTAGGIYLIGQLLIIGLAMLVGGGALMDLLFNGTRVSENELRTVSGDMLSASLVLLTLSIPLMMATWFAPPLIIFNNIAPYAAMRKSFFACLLNFLPLQIYIISFTVLIIIASAIPYGLGLLILIPTLFSSIYASYRGIFFDITEDNLLEE